MSKDGSTQFADFELMYHNALCGLLLLDINGTIIQCNQTLLDWLGMTNEEVSGMKFTDLLDQGGKFYYQLFVHPLLRMHKEVKEINFQIETATASFSCLLSASAIDINNQRVINAVVFKMVDRKKYEDELLIRKAKADEENLRIGEALKMVAFAQSHLVRAPLANILGLVSLFDDMELDADMQSLNQMLKVSATKLDIELRKIVSKTNDEQ